MKRNELDRRNFLSWTGKGLGLAALSSTSVGALLKNIQAATRGVAHLTPEQAAMNEDFWFEIQKAFTVTRGIINLNNGGVSPSPRIVTEALVRYIWQQEDATAYTMWQILEPQSETIRTGLAELFGCDREEIAITRNASESLETLLLGLDLKSGDEVLTTTQITPVKAVCEMARARGVETIVDGAHSFAQFYFKQPDVNCDYFGTSLHKWLYAPKGTGLLYVRREKISKVWPLFAAEDKEKSDIRKFEEIGTHSAAPKLAIGEALLFHDGIGGKRKEARLRHLSRYWMDKLKDTPKIRFNTSFDPAQMCAIANVQVEGLDQGKIGSYLFAKHHIFTTPIVHEEFQGLRITPNLYTTLPELDRFCEVLETIARKGLPA